MSAMLTLQESRIDCMLDACAMTNYDRSACDDKGGTALDKALFKGKTHLQVWSQSESGRFSRMPTAGTTKVLSFTAYLRSYESRAPEPRGACVFLRDMIPSSKNRFLMKLR